jgi:lipopolysaccharide/colanic/teichoic acid biosynthesis glycosyltransferase
MLDQMKRNISTLKRIFDFTTSFACLILLSPLFFLIGLLIMLNDKGPALFKQKRVGRDGKLFVLYKFRSMKNIESPKQENFEPGSISRITSIGKLLRKTKLDELPQLYNVLKGDMSLVGPRPEVEKWVAVYPDRWKRVLSIKPGMTDNSSITFRNEESLLAKSNDPEKTYKEIILPRKLDFYEEYIINNSFYGDLKLIFKTLYSVIFY